MYALNLQQHGHVSARQPNPQRPSYPSTHDVAIEAVQSLHVGSLVIPAGQGWAPLLLRWHFDGGELCQERVCVRAGVWRRRLDWQH
ncbi:hypothetical protein CGCTS75_v010428 [Colletotrichum tropicale]|nr:hypothetical protein CGCTS75_v010428 [Colletotrichum tropicale]